LKNAHFSQFLGYFGAKLGTFVRKVGKTVRKLQEIKEPQFDKPQKSRRLKAASTPRGNTGVFGGQIGRDPKQKVEFSTEEVDSSEF